MPTYAIIQTGVVTNVIEADAEFAATIGAVPAPAGVGIGHTHADGVFTAPAPVVSVPAAVSPRQIRQALTAAGLRASVEAAIAASNQDTKDWYEFSTSVERSHSMVASMGTALGVSSAQLDDLFIAAGAL